MFHKGKKYSDHEQVSKLKIILHCCLLCLTACLCLLCRWRWMQMISAIAHAPKVSAWIHTQQHYSSGWPSLPQHKCIHMHTYILHTHHCTNPRLSQLSYISSLLSLSLFLWLTDIESQSAYFKRFVQNEISSTVTSNPTKIYIVQIMELCMEKTIGNSKQF